MVETPRTPRTPGRPMGFNVVRVPFFLEPNYAEDETWTESNRDRLVRKWGGQAGWEAQKQRHNLKGRGQEVGIEKFNLDRRASSTLASHRLVQWVTHRSRRSRDLLARPRRVPWHLRWRCLRCSPT